MWFDKNGRLRRAIKRGNLLQVTSLIEKGADLNPPCCWDNRPLAVAARQGHLDVLKLLIAQGANVNPGEPYETPLQCAETVEIARVLIEQGVSKFSQHHVLVTEALTAMLAGNDRLNMLLDAGLDIEARNFEGDTPLIALVHFVCSKNPAGSPCLGTQIKWNLLRRFCVSLLR